MKCLLRRILLPSGTTQIFAAAGFALVLAGCAIVAPLWHQNEMHSAIRKVNAPASGSASAAHILFAKLAPAVGLDPRRIYIAGQRSEHVNAAAFGDRHFVVTFGLLKTENQCVLVGVVAHELAHDVLDHPRAQVVSATGIGVLATAAGLVIPGGGYLVQGAGWLGLRAYGRSQEAEADARAIELLTKSGTPSWTLRYALEFIQDVYGDQGGSWLDTHPATAERIKNQPEIDQEVAARLCPPADKRQQQIAARRSAIALERQATAKKPAYTPPPTTEAPESCRGPRDQWTGYACESR